MQVKLVEGEGKVFFFLTGASASLVSFWWKSVIVGKKVSWGGGWKGKSGSRIRGDGRARGVME